MKRQKRVKDRVPTVYKQTKAERDLFVKGFEKRHPRYTIDEFGLVTRKQSRLR